VGSYIHAGGKIGVLVELNCESDFVARTDAFQQLSHDIAMHVAALDPRYVRREEVTPEMLEKEREIYRAQALATGKPEAVVEKIVTGKMEKFYEENCLYEQHYIKDESVTIGEMITQAIAKLGENIRSGVSRASRSAKSRRGVCNTGNRAGAGAGQGLENHSTESNFCERPGETGALFF